MAFLKYFFIGFAFYFIFNLFYQQGFKHGYSSVYFDIERHDRKMQQCTEALAQVNVK
jgi:hypothetical protein